jgi:hypothetical protein
MSKKTSKYRIFKLLDRVGVFLVIGALFLILLSKKLSEKNEIYLDVSSFLLFIGILLMIPDTWLFVIDLNRKNKKLADYMFVQFLRLPLVAVLLIVYFIVRLVRS